MREKQCAKLDTISQLRENGGCFFPLLSLELRKQRMTLCKISGQEYQANQKHRKKITKGKKQHCKKLSKKNKSRENIYFACLSITITLHSPQGLKVTFSYRLLFQVCARSCVYLCPCLCVSDHPQLLTDQSNCLDGSVIYRYTPPPSLPSSLSCL